MVNHKEILRLKSLGLTHREIVDAAGCGRNTVTRTLAWAREQKLDWQQAQSMSQQEVSQRLFPTEQKNPVYKMPDYESFPAYDFWWKLSEDGSTQRKPKSCGILRILASVFRFYLNPPGFPSSSRFCPEL